MNLRKEKITTYFNWGKIIFIFIFIFIGFKIFIIEDRINCLPLKHKGTFINVLYENGWQSLDAKWQNLNEWFPKNMDIIHALKIMYDFNFCNRSPERPALNHGRI